jgi:ABC-type dipeptide/oligopeptide/nickel transport system permease subunit
MSFFFKKKTEYTPASLSRDAWRKLIHNKLALAAIIYIFLSLLVAILGYLIIPDSSPMANQQYLELSARKPGFKVQMLKIPRNDSQGPVNVFRKMIYGEKPEYQLIPIESFSYENGTLTAISYTGDDAVAGHTLTFNFPGNEWKQHVTTRKFLLGTDQFGRDLLSRLMLGSRVSLSVGFISVLISLILGISIGAAGGFFRGWVDKIVIWLINVVWSIPTFLMVIALTFALGKGFWQVFIAVGFTMWVEVARVTRGQILAIREKEYIEAARALGFSDFRIIFRHILPNISGPVIVISAANFASAILIEAGLSFLGIGVQPPMPSWGNMIRENYAYLLLDAVHLAILPGLAIMLIVLAFMILGNGLRDAMDVKSAKSVQI